MCAEGSGPAETGQILGFLNLNKPARNCKSNPSAQSDLDVDRQLDRPLD